MLREVQTTSPTWNDLLPTMFSDFHFRKTSRRRWQAEINGARAGIVVAWRPGDYENFGLNKPDVDLLLKLRRDGKFDAAFVVLANVNFGSAYVGHRDAEELYEALKSAHFRTGPHGEYWLLREDFSPFDNLAPVPEW